VSRTVNVNAYIGARIKAHLKEQKITQVKMAEWLHISPITLNVKLSGAYAFTADELAEICRRLSVSADEILGVNV